MRHSKASQLVDRLLRENESEPFPQDSKVVVVLNLSGELASWLQETLNQIVDISDSEEDSPDRESAQAILDLMGTGGKDEDGGLYPNGDPDPNVVPYNDQSESRATSSTSALEQSKGFEKDPEVRRAIQKLLSKLDQARETSQNVENDPGVRYATSTLLDKIAQAQEMDQTESVA